jgi:hypothetical protein
LKIKMSARDKAGNWHGGAKVFTLSLYLEVQNPETRDRVWTAIEKALPEPEEKQGRKIGLQKEDTP